MHFGHNRHMILSAIYILSEILGAIGIAYLCISYRRYTKDVDERLKHTSYWW